MPKNLTIYDCCALAENKGGKFLSSKCLGSKKKYLWKCKNDHQWLATYNKVQNGRWCPHCYKASRNVTKDKCDKLAKQHKGKFTGPPTPANSKQKLNWVCIRDHSFSMNYNNVQQGQWCPLCAEGKRIKTRIEKYGVPYLMQNKELAMKAARKNNNSYIVRHWKTKEELVCVGSYERKVVEFLNKKRIEFLWQPKFFHLSCGKYRPDIYLIQKDVYVEIKGYFRKDAKKKWEEFSRLYRSELWNKPKLEEMNIL